MRLCRGGRAIALLRSGSTTKLATEAMAVAAPGAKTGAANEGEPRAASLADGGARQARGCLLALTGPAPACSVRLRAE